MESEPGNAVLIGEALAASEELLPGPGTYDDGAMIRASRMGRFRVDVDEFAAVVEPTTNTPVLLQKDDIVIGEVYIVKESMTGIRVVCRADAPDRNVTGETDGTLHVAKMANRYVEAMDQEFKKGDIVRARVVQSLPSLQLETKGPEFGVIKAFSTKTREPLKRVPGALIPASMSEEDPDVRRFSEYRYIAQDYGRGSLVPDEDHFVARDLRAPPRGGGFRGGGRGGPGGRGGGRGGPGGRGGGGRGYGGRGGDRRDGGGRGGDRRGGGGRGGDRRDGGGRGGDRRGGGGRGGDRGGRGRRSD